MVTMSAGAPVTPVPAPSPVDPAAARSTRWSWIMVGLFFVVWVLGAVLGMAALPWVGLAEGHLLSEAGGTGWLVAAGLLLLEVSPAVVGAVLGARATRLGGGALAASAFAVNVLLAVFALTVQLVQLAGG
ncbi:hypothetical protein [Kineosporia sp. A_224]|uniref:hypothetical protein n=1 Tax=Kineosporia sp. A_224 TaxID=1962180 RepID=UPI00117A1D0E|nr:hypothetical protein [Kineosporia sp. A_224]